jgi:pyridoxal/pyridoxine/pyridoxamine kinase
VVLPAQQQPLYVLAPGQQQQQQFVLVQQQQQPNGTGDVLGALLSGQLTLSQCAPAVGNTGPVMQSQQQMVAAHQVCQQQQQQPQQYLGLGSGQVAYTTNSLPLSAGNQVPY